MTTIRRCVCFILLMGLLIFTQTRSALADATRLPATFMRCDDLLGKSTEAVLAALGPPVRTYELSAAASGAPPDSTLPVGLHVVSWSYTSAETTRDLTLIFSNGVLVAARIDDMAYAKILAGLLKTCKPASLKYIYAEKDTQKTKPGKRRIRDLTSYLEDDVPAFSWCPTIVVLMAPENASWLQQ